MLSVSGVATMLMNYLGVPLGAKVKSMTNKNDGKGWTNENVKNMELIAAILSITVDDVCIGSEPFYYKSDETPSRIDKVKLDKVLKEFNEISKWIAYDLLADGVSVYKPKIVGKSIYFVPILKTLKFVLNSKREVIVYDENDHKINDVLVFINYNKTSLSVRQNSRGEDEEDTFDITPLPIQLQNVQQTAQELSMTEKAIQRYRKTISKIVRFVHVEVGLAKGNDNQDLIDDISSGINADSLTLEGTSPDMFEDQIPVFPTRKGLGKPEIEESVPSADITGLSDLDHIMGKLFLSTKFPKTYADFSTALDSSAVSLIRGDIRYARMLKTARSLMEKTINDYFKNLKVAKKYKVVFKLQEIPSPEDADVIESMRGYQDFLNDAYDYIFADAETAEQANYKLDSFVELLGTSANMKTIESWIQLTRAYIKVRFKIQDEVIPEEEDLEEEDEAGVTSRSELEEFMNDEPVPSSVPEDQQTEEETTEESQTYAPGEQPSFEPEPGTE